jgi:hypothetical protein
MERETLLVARILREDLLQQSDTKGVDAFCPLDKSYWMMKVILHFHEAALGALKKGISLQDLENAQVLQKIARMKEQKLDTMVDRMQFLMDDIDNEISRLSEKLRSQMHEDEQIKRLITKEFRTVNQIRGPLIFVERVSDVALMKWSRSSTRLAIRVSVECWKSIMISRSSNCSFPRKGWIFRARV